MNEQILERIDALAAKLGVVGEHLWEVLVRQVYVDYAVMWVYVLLCAWGTYVLVRNILRMINTGSLIPEPPEGQYRSHNDTDKVEASWVTVVIACTIVLAILDLIGIIWLGTSAGNVFNPEYAALQNLLP